MKQEWDTDRQKRIAARMGYGTQIIQRIVDENGGTIRYVDAGDTMQITCRLCMEDKKLLSEG